MGRLMIAGLMTMFLLVTACGGGPLPAPIEISAGLDGNGQCAVTWNDRPLTPDTVAELKRVAHGRPVHLVGDASVPYRCIGGAIYTMQAAGIGKIGFISEPPSAGIVLIVPSGEPCAPTVDGRRMTLAELRPIAEQWGRKDVEIHFQPDPYASYDCVDSILTVLKAAKAANLGFIGNEAYVPTQGQTK